MLLECPLKRDETLGGYCSQTKSFASPLISIKQCQLLDLIERIRVVNPDTDTGLSALTKHTAQNQTYSGVEDS